MKSLICNADDFGLSHRITDAIVDSHIDGIITSTTVMANMSAVEYACLRAKELRSLGVGVHLTLTKGSPVLPVSKVPVLVNEEGQFLSAVEQRKRLRLNKKAAAQVEEELRAQVERVLDLGVRPTHCDSHHAIHKLPLVRRVMVRVMKRYGISKARRSGGYFWTCSDSSVCLKAKRVLLNFPHSGKEVVHKWNWFQLKRAGIKMPDYKPSRELLLPRKRGAKEYLIWCIHCLPSGISELVFHPGYYDDKESGDSESFSRERRIDMELVTDKEVRKVIEQAAIKLISFREL